MTKFCIFSLALQLQTNDATLARSQKLLGVHITEDLIWTLNTCLAKKSQQHLNFLQRLKRATSLPLFHPHHFLQGVSRPAVSMSGLGPVPSQTSRLQNTIRKQLRRSSGSLYLPSTSLSTNAASARPPVLWMTSPTPLMHSSPNFHRAERLHLHLADDLK